MAKRSDIKQATIGRLRRTGQGKACRKVPPACGRPRRVRAVHITEICERVAGGETLTRICATSRLPSKACVLKFLARDPSFQRAFTAAKELRAEHWAEEILDIVDADSGQAKGRETLQRAKMRVEARKWLLARLAARYGPPTVPSQPLPDQVPVVEAFDDLPALDDLTEEERDVLRAILARRLERSEEGA